MIQIRSFVLGATCAASLVAAFQQSSPLADRPQPLLSAAAYEFLAHVRMVDTTDASGARYRTAVLDGVNLQLRNGAGATESANGLGNLILGYAELGGSAWPTPGPIERSGSHSIVIGRAHAWTSHGGIVVGEANRAGAPYALAHGRSSEVAGAHGATIAAHDGGALEVCSAAVGGWGSAAVATSAVVVGGFQGRAAGAGSVAVGGENPVASGVGAAALGGAYNRAQGDASVVTGGRDNYALGDDSTVSGGRLRQTTGPHAWAAGALYQSE